MSASLVLFHNPPELFGSAITDYLAADPQGTLVVVDNSSQPLQSEWFAHPRVHYLYSGANLGFGAGHNRAIREVGTTSDIHLLINPDVRFGPEVLPYLIGSFESDPAIGAAMPRITYADGTLQQLCKLLPTPRDLFFRRFLPLPAMQAQLNRRYELHGLPQNRIVDVPTLSGCFLAVRTELLRELKGFDERFFMYMEDVDLVRRIGDFARTVYAPGATVVHGYAKGSYASRRLLNYHVTSARRYFDKWGWWFDPVRRARNRQALALLPAGRRRGDRTACQAAAPSS